MSDVLWPGQHRAGGFFDDAAVVRAVVAVEGAWAQALEAGGHVPVGTAKSIRAWRPSEGQLALVAAQSEGSGNPLVPLLSLLREHVGASDAERAAAVHRGLTSQDVVDTALLLASRTCLLAIRDELDEQVRLLAALATRHRDTLLVGRTLGQHALPTTFGARVSGWLLGVLDARDAVVACVDGLPVQLGGAVGTLAATVEMCRAAGSTDPLAATRDLVASAASQLGLRAHRPWAVTRGPVTLIGDALVTVSDALGHLANDVALQARPELGELAEPTRAGRGGSSTMPQKRNPVLCVLIRRQAMSAPLLAAQLHLAAAAAVDERPDGAWHTEWAPLRDLSRRTLVATRQATELLAGLEVHADVMRKNLDDALPGGLAERLVPALAHFLPGGRPEVTRLIATSGGVHEFVEAVSAVAGEALPRLELMALLDPTAYLGIAGAIVAEAVAAAQPSSPTPS